MPLQDAIQRQNTEHNAIDEDCRRIANHALDTTVTRDYETICDAVAKQISEGQTICKGYVCVGPGRIVATDSDIHYGNFGLKYRKIIEDTLASYGLILSLPLATDDPGFEVRYIIYNTKFDFLQDGDCEIETYIPHKNLHAYIAAMQEKAHADGITIRPILRYTTEHWSASKFRMAESKSLGKEYQYEDDIYSPHRFVNNHARYDYGVIHPRKADRTKLEFLFEYEYKKVTLIKQ